MTETPKRRTDRLTLEQRADIKARVATWPKLTEAQRAQVAVLFGPYLDSLGKRPDRRS
jgi:hypothetical protein